MATTIEEILGRDINSIKELRSEIKRLQDSIANADPTTDEFKSTVEKLTAAQTQLNNVTRAGKQDFDAAADSIVGMEREYKALYNTYKMMTDEQRKSPMGKKMAEDLKELSDKLNDTKKQVGNWKDNIGRYSESVQDAFSKMGVSLGGLQQPLSLVKNGFNALGTALKTNPIFLIATVIAGVVKVFGELKEAVGKNEELQRRWNTAMAAFQPIMNWLQNAIDKVAQGLVWVVEKAAQAWNWLRRVFKASAQEGETAEQAIERRKQALTDLERSYKVTASAQNAEIQRLREEASATRDLAQRASLLTQAKDMQLELDTQAVEIAQERLDIEKAESELTPNSVADNERLVQLEVELNNAKANLSNNQRQFNKQLQAATPIIKSNTKAIKEETEALDEYEQKANEIYNRTVEDNKTEVQKVKEKYEQELALLKQYNLDTQLLTKQYNDKMLELDKKAQQDRIAAGLESYNTRVKGVESASNGAVSLLRYFRFAGDEERKELKAQLEGMLKEVMPPFTQEEINRILANAIDPKKVETAVAELIERLAAFKYNASLSAFKAGGSGVTLEEVIQNAAEYTEVFVSKEELAAERTKEIWEGVISTFDMVNTSILTVANSYSALINQELQSGKITKQESEKKKKTLIALEKVMLAVNIAQIAASTAVGIQDVWKNYAAELASNTATFGPAAAPFNIKSLTAAIIRTAGLTTMGAANIAAASMGTIAKVKSIEQQDAGATASAGVGASPTQIDSTPFSYTRQVQTQDEIDQLNRPIWVSVKDIDNAQATVRVTEAESSF